VGLSGSAPFAALTRAMKRGNSCTYIQEIKTFGFFKSPLILLFMSRKILFVDDEEELRSMVGEYLKFMGHEFWPAANAGEALRIAGEIPLDVIILDLNLGGESGGSSLLSLLNQKRPGVPILLYTGMESDDDAVKAMLAQGKNAHYLRKDGSLEELANAVQRVME
jgi:DNA-binding response OmpR family regulator